MTDEELLEDLFLIADRKKTEYTILKNLSDEWRYIARDASGDLFLYKNKPIRKGDLWDTDVYLKFSCYNHLFEFITWESRQVYKIKEILDEKS